jgi:hypothetical protein
MAWISRVATVAALVAVGVLAGCRVPDYLRVNYLQTGGAGPGDRVVAGSLEAVAGSTEARLQQLGIQTLLTEEGDAIRIACTTRSGGRFFLVLTRVQTPEGERTRLRLELGSGLDVKTGLQVLADLELDRAR